MSEALGAGKTHESQDKIGQYVHTYTYSAFRSQAVQIRQTAGQVLPCPGPRPTPSSVCCFDAQSGIVQWSKWILVQHRRGRPILDLLLMCASVHRRSRVPRQCFWVQFLVAVPGLPGRCFARLSCIAIVIRPLFCAALPVCPPWRFSRFRALCVASLGLVSSFKLDWPSIAPTTSQLIVLHYLRYAPRTS